MNVLVNKFLKKEILLSKKAQPNVFGLFLHKNWKHFLNEMS